MKKDLAVLSLNQSELATSIASKLSVPLLDISFKKFPSNEFYIRLNDSVRGKEVFVVHSFTSNISDELMSLFILLDCLKRSFAETVHLFIPYMPYARQDRVSEPREPISAKLLASLLDTAGADHVISCELHSPQIQGFFSKPMDNINLLKLFAHYLKSTDLSNSVVIAPDMGGAKLAKALGDKLGLEIAILHKSRPSHGKAEINQIVGDVAGKNCIIIDDMVDTGGSVSKAFEALKSKGALDISLAFIHPVLSDGALLKLDKIGFKEMIVTNSLPLDNVKLSTAIEILDLSELIADVFSKITNNESVTQTLDV